MESDLLLLFAGKKEEKAITQWSWFFLYYERLPLVSNSSDKKASIDSDLVREAKQKKYTIVRNNYYLKTII
ncbi:hypothetical protein BpHYR1_042654 [Brachionus plicatilis]|uniref:Uncharacterized protein n=1 Tax=Brachionus plicatilis TaxID=10195 RepID=A0A3M7QAD4_BRAPC|nr:hypothetical protein BpHYR1_042654 [Brachionus plicatilis]